MPTLGTPIPIGVTIDEKAALQGTSGTPSASNKYVTADDNAVNMSDATPTVIDPDDAGSAGTGTQPSREDHQHEITTAAPTQGIGGSNAEGSASTFARSDHDHLIRETDGPTDLSVGDIPDNYSLIRSGASIVGVNPYNPDRAVVVAKTALGADATTIADAIVAANALSPAPSASAPAVIVVHPGVYSTPPFTLPNYVSLVGVGGPDAVVLEASTTTAALCTANGGSRIQNVRLKGANGVGGVGVENGGTTTSLHLSNVEIDDCTVGIHVDGSGKITHIVNCEIYGCDDGVLVENDGECRIDGLCIKTSVIGLRIATSDGVIKGNAFRVLDDSGFTWHVQVQGSNGILTLTGSEYFEDKTDFHNSAEINVQHMSLIPGDEAMNVTAELHVGTEIQGRECAFGGGDSHTRKIAYLRNTNLEAGTWSNVTTQLKDEDASSVDLFPGTGIGNSFYVGADYQFPGLKTLITTARVGGALILEFWNGSSWVSIPHLSSQADAPYAQYAQNVFTRTGSEQIRFGNRTAWATKSLNGITKYWIRFRVSTALTTSPAADRIKAHTDRMEVNADGTPEWFGAAEPLRQLIWHRKLMEEMEGFAQPDWDVDIATTPTLSIRGLSNRWQDGNKDGSTTFVHALPGLDTSRPLIYEVGWYKNAVGSGNVELQLDAVTVNPGNVINGALPYTQQLSQIVAVGGVAAFELIVTQFSLLVPDLGSNGSLVLALYRDASGGNLDDTYGDDCAHIFSRLYGTFWR